MNPSKKSPTLHQRTVFGNLDPNVCHPPAAMRGLDKGRVTKLGRAPPSGLTVTPKATGGPRSGGYLTPKEGTPNSSSGFRTPGSSPGSAAEITPGATSSAGSNRSGYRERYGYVSPVPLSVNQLPSKFLLPPQSPTQHGKLTIVFDLDETLVSNRRPGVATAIPRPYLTHLLKSIRDRVEIVLWTASTEETGRPVMQQIDPKGEFFHHVIYRNSKWFTDGTHTKDLTLLGRSMERTIIVENTPNCCKYNQQNALMVEDFVGDLTSTDRTLLGVSQVIRGAIESCSKVVSVPRYLRHYSKVPGCSVEVYELGLPLVYKKIPVEEAMRKIATLEPLMRPPLGLYYYVKKN
eukprot:TRINITY_DN6730_c0_g1_i1.p1 TRINITY_DN6730_c0_g1~~TRINITY_DN6730_c0_g1_i1.p1  ORF type:complete len:348 (+),score=55.97 TRINITY_DN6730_c0_g1_i1:388-1431(+)